MTHLRLSEDVMRALGYRGVDMVVEHLSRLGDGPVSGREGWPAHEGVPWEPAADPMAVLEETYRLLTSGNAHPDHPRFLAFVPSPGNFVGVLASMLATGFAVPGGWRLTGAGAADVELAAVRWVVELLGLPEGAGGLFVPGGSLANLTALTVARDQVGAGVAYFSDQAHFSIPRALHVLGVGAEQLPSDRAQRLDVEVLASAVRRDRCAGRRPFAVVANAGTTSTGAVDPLPELAEFCRAEGLWLHVDGAFGAAAALTETGREALDGLGLADSWTVDPHKWLFQPAELGCVLLRRPQELRETFGVRLPGYLGENMGGDGDFMQYGIQLTREFRALRLWLSLKVFGAEAFRDAVAQGMRNAEELGRFIDAEPGVELVTAPSLAVLTFRRPGADADRVCRELREEGDALVMPTTVDGERVFRLCTINPRADLGELKSVVRRLRELS
ncbi:pyridoxal phosphate-dependent decarboxylase family protein [Streptomyces acidiscabies]|uniref:pyridoxal phosphate-dependent decarboxylase family protein n=1 Tax=Streptomyces acidiscabies TaxID=42234 RepID=UPI000A4F916C|nr:pyridoxal-dependent decarboxylase [Streptomyces acidiscabies]